MTNKNTVLTLNGKTIHSLQELRDNFKAEELILPVLIEFCNNHYYALIASILTCV